MKPFILPTPLPKLKSTIILAALAPLSLLVAGQDEFSEPPTTAEPSPSAEAETAPATPSPEALAASALVETVIEIAKEAGATDAHLERIENCSQEIASTRNGAPAFQFRNDRQALEIYRGMEDVIGRHGFQADARPWSYYSARLEEASSAEEIDPILLTAFLHSSLAIRTGLASNEDFWPKWSVGDKPGVEVEQKAWEDWCAITSEATLTAATTAERLDAIAPRTAMYAQLQEAYLRYRKEWANASWPEVPDPGQSIRVGDSYEHASLLQKRLALEGYKADLEDPLVFSESLAAALEDFQLNQGLEKDGILGPNSLSTLNQSPAERLAKLRVNMERARWLPDTFGERYVVVNVPSGQLRAFTRDKPELQMRVVYGNGALDRTTPVMRDVMEVVIFRPYWNVPHSIAVNELIPKLEQDGWYFAHNDYEIVNEFSPDATVYRLDWRSVEGVKRGDLKIRQRSGGSNALGKVKFLFPNAQNVYLHDTPEKHLFKRHDRGFSHGCVRVQHPDELAQWVLGWPIDRVHQAMESRQRQVVTVDPEVDVYIVYLTAETTSDGSVRFFKDVYNQDEGIAKTLEPHIQFAGKNS